MDCHVFRRLCDELAPALMGCRIEKIHRPAKDVTLFTLYGTGGKRFLFLRAGRKAPFLFLSTHKIPVGSAPPADIMRLRKYLADRRIIDVLPDWGGAAFTFMSTPIPNAGLRSICGKAPRCFSTRRLSLKFRHGPIPRTGPKPVKATAGGTGRSSRRPLRRTLPLLPPDEQAALLLDLEAGGGDLFLYENAAGERELSAWPLPPERRRDADGTPREELVVEDAIRACAAAGKRKSCAASRPSLGPKRPNPIRPRPTACANSCSSWRAKKTPQRHGCGTGCRPPAPIAALPFFCGGKTRLRHAGRGRRACRSCPRSPPHRP